jgi:hypothetical protein
MYFPKQLYKQWKYSVFCKVEPEVLNLIQMELKLQNCESTEHKLLLLELSSLYKHSPPHRYKYNYFDLYHFVSKAIPGALKIQENFSIHVKLCPVFKKKNMNLFKIATDKP